MLSDQRQNQLLRDRRILHRRPETGWLEFESTLRLLGRLKKLGWICRSGRSLHAGERYGLPTEAEKKAHRNDVSGRPDYQEILSAAEVSEAELREIEDGYTGIIADFDSGRPGCLTVLRFDMDALEIQESCGAEHRPAKEGFRSEREGCCHACGHDAHMSLGLAAADLIARDKRLRGRWRLLFQPAEESARGARSMLEAGAIEGADLFLCCHIGLTEPEGRTGIGTVGFLASSKYELIFRGRESHAGLAPEEGRNALLAAAALTLQLQALPQYGKGMSRVNVGILRAGSAANIIPGEAYLSFEFRGETAAIQEDLRRRVVALCKATEEAYGLQAELHLRGDAPAFLSRYPELARDLAAALKNQGFSVDLAPDFGASEDVTTFMNAVEERGGKALHLLFGARLAAPHHHPSFDFTDEDLLLAWKALEASLLYFSEQM